MNTPHPVLLCRIIGHKWSVKRERADLATDGKRVYHHSEKPACVRCGEPNPNYVASLRERLRDK